MTASVSLDDIRHMEFKLHQPFYYRDVNCCRLLVDNLHYRCPGQVSFILEQCYFSSLSSQHYFLKLNSILNKSTKETNKNYLHLKNKASKKTPDVNGEGKKKSAKGKKRKILINEVCLFWGVIKQTSTTVSDKRRQSAVQTVTFICLKFSWSECQNNLLHTIWQI